MSENAPGELDVALRVAWVLEGLGLRYLIGGSVASAVLGEPRATNDVDFLVEIPLTRVSDLAAALGPEFEVDQEALCEAIRQGRSSNVFFLPYVTKIDLFVKKDAFDESELRRRLWIPMGAGGQGIYIASPEDLIVKKLAWYRLGGEISTAQWRDVLGVLAISGQGLDRQYLDGWAVTLGVADLLERALQESARGGGGA